MSDEKRQLIRPGQLWTASEEITELELFWVVISIENDVLIMWSCSGPVRISRKSFLVFFKLVE